MLWHVPRFPAPHSRHRAGACRSASLTGSAHTHWPGAGRETRRCPGEDYLVEEGTAGARREKVP